MVWVNRYLQAQMCMPIDARPMVLTAALTIEDGQVPAAPPELVRRVDWYLRGAMKQGGATVTLMMGVMTMIASWLRFRHLQRAMPTSLTQHLLWVMVTKAKRPDQSGRRRGYRVAIPRFSPCGVDVGQYLWGQWHQEAERRGSASPGLLFDSDGGLLSLRAFNLGVQRILANEKFTSSPELVTSYSWRRSTDSMGEARGLQPHELAAMGSWQPAAGAGSAGNPSMPLRYAGDKLNGAAASRLTHVKVLRSIWVKCPAQADLSWERFRRELHEVDENAVRREVADLILDDVVVATVAAGTIPGLKQWREITLGPCPSLSSRAERLRELCGVSAAPSLADSGGSSAAPSSTPPPAPSADRATPRAWVIPRNPTGKLHFSTTDTATLSLPIWLCCQSARGKFADAIYKGQGLLEGVAAAKPRNRRVCESCRGHLCDAEAEMVDKDMNR